MSCIQQPTTETLKTAVWIHSIDSDPISIALKRPSLTVIQRLLTMIHNCVITQKWDST